MIAAEAVARSSPDGYTFLLTLHSQLAQAPVLLQKPPIDPSKDLVPIGSIGVGPVVAVVNKNLQVNNLAELIDLARKRPVSVGNYAIGSGWELMLAKLAKQTGAQFTIVNYKGTVPANFPAYRPGSMRASRERLSKIWPNAICCWVLLEHRPRSLTESHG